MTTTIAFKGQSVCATFESSNINAEEILFALMKYRNDPRIWDMVQLVLEYDEETEEERENIEKTLIEMLRNEPVELP